MGGYPCRIDGLERSFCIEAASVGYSSFDNLESGVLVMVLSSSEIYHGRVVVFWSRVVRSIRFREGRVGMVS